MSSAKWRPFCLGLNVLAVMNPEYFDPYLSYIAHYVNNDYGYTKLDTPS